MLFPLTPIPSPTRGEGEISLLLGEKVPSVSEADEGQKIPFVKR